MIRHLEKVTKVVTIISLAVAAIAAPSHSTSSSSDVSLPHVLPLTTNAAVRHRSCRPRSTRRSSSSAFPLAHPCIDVGKFGRHAQLHSTPAFVSHASVAVRDVPKATAMLRLDFRTTHQLRCDCGIGTHRRDGRTVLHSLGFPSSIGRRRRTVGIALRAAVKNADGGVDDVEDEKTATAMDGERDTVTVDDKEKKKGGTRKATPKKGSNKKSPKTRHQDNSKWVLVVEDEDTIRRAAGRYLSEKGGYRVTGLVDAASALAVLGGIFGGPDLMPLTEPGDPGRRVPDCLVLDVRLGEHGPTTPNTMDGLELLRVMRADPASFPTSIPVVLMTARGRADDRIAGYEAGADAYISKPFDPDELLAVVDSFLNREKFEQRREEEASTTMTVDQLREELREIKELLTAPGAVARLRKSRTVAAAGGGGQKGKHSRDEPSADTIRQDLIEIKETIKGGTTPDNVVPSGNSTSSSKKESDEEPGEEPERPSSLLTPAEENILTNLKKGLTNSEIAIETGLAPATVSNYLSAMFRKTGVKNRTELVRWDANNDSGANEKGSLNS